MSAETTPSSTVTRKPDDDVGTPGASPAGNGRQTPEQAAITGTGEGGRSDAERSREHIEAGGKAGYNPSPVGGSSGGHADQKSATASGKVADGHYAVEKDHER